MNKPVYQKLYVSGGKYGLFIFFLEEGRDDHADWINGGL